jgi:twinfilin-like protein
VGIQKETLVPFGTIDSKSADFFDDLESLQTLLKNNEAAYVILRRYTNAPDGFVAVTYVPDTANVRQKMLFASTRLNLVRELGAERFRDTLFATTKEELTAEGWRKHDKHGELKAPLTEEERTLQNVKEAEAETSRGTTERVSHFTHGLRSSISPEAIGALKSLPSSDDNLVQMV